MIERMVYNTVWDKINAYLVFIIPILIIGVLLNIIKFPIIAILIFLSFIFLCNNHEKSVVCALVFCKLIGTFGPVLGIHVPGTVVSFILIIVFMRKELFMLFNKHTKKPLIFILAIYLIFVIYFLLTGETKNSATKISVMTISLFVDTVAFLVLVTFKDIRMNRLTVPFLLFALMQLGYVESFSGHGPSGLLDFSFFRNACIEMMRKNIPVLSYHNMGIAAFLGAAFMMSQRKKVNNYFDIVFLFSALWLIVLSGARQTIFGFIFLIFVWIVFRTGRFKLTTVILASAVIVGFYLCLQLLEVPFLQGNSSRGAHMGSDLNRNYDYPLMIISYHFLDGIGFGNYNNPYTHEIYPHNIILEILCEMGFFGMIFVGMVVFSYVRSHHFLLRNELPSGGICLLLWIPYLVRSMISGDLSENISLFISMFLLFYYRGIVLSTKQLERLMRLRQSSNAKKQQLATEAVSTSNEGTGDNK
ncbi:MAG: O-antigen ligase family protein [Paludibacteraceae bacterium]|nr:O-antigen ligase family protein [Paludibacteraceae bacterium]